MAINEKSILTIDELRQGLEGEITLADSIQTGTAVVVEEVSSRQTPVIPVAKFIATMVEGAGDVPRTLRTPCPEGDAFDNLAMVRAKRDEEYKQRLNLALRAIGEAEAA